jgi:GH15 family glucan-1,4-alpha-glucosidase
LADQERVEFVLRYDEDEVRPVAEYESRHKLAETVDWWKTWASKLRYTGPYGDLVQRSALALKLCCYAPTGAIVAAPTTSLPESLGGIRNWDYRYMWLRDAAFVLFALERSGYTDEVDSFAAFLKRLTRRADGNHLQIMFGVEGARELPEMSLDHFEGYRGTKPVRIGNAAATQFQLDVYGEVLETLHVRHRRSAPSEGLWNSVRGLVEWTAQNWQQPDWSIWEVRGEARHFVFSKIMAWTALERGAQMAQQSGLGGDVAHWRREAARIREEVLKRGWDDTRKTFVQAYDHPELDAAVLVMPLLRFIPRNDPRVASTLEAVRRELHAGSDDLLYRYLGDDGLPGVEGAFVLCCFWMVQVLAMTGQFDEAEGLFRKLLARATPLGLYGEEIDPASGAHLGNFPQALSHAGVISTAHLLERLRPLR